MLHVKSQSKSWASLVKLHQQAFEAKATQRFWPSSHQEVLPFRTNPTALPKILCSMKFQFFFRNRIPASASQFIFSLQSDVRCLSVGKRELRSGCAYCSSGRHTSQGTQRIGVFVPTWSICRNPNVCLFLPDANANTYRDIAYEFSIICFIKNMVKLIVFLFLSLLFSCWISLPPCPPS